MTTATAHPRVATVAAARDTGAHGTVDRLGRMEALVCADLYRSAHTATWSTTPRTTAEP